MIKRFSNPQNDPKITREKDGLGGTPGGVGGVGLSSKPQDFDNIIHKEVGEQPAHWLVGRLALCLCACVRVCVKWE